MTVAWLSHATRAQHNNTTQPDKSTQERSYDQIRLIDCSILSNSDISPSIWTNTMTKYEDSITSVDILNWLSSLLLLVLLMMMMMMMMMLLSLESLYANQT